MPSFPPSSLSLITFDKSRALPYLFTRIVRASISSARSKKTAPSKTPNTFNALNPQPQPLPPKRPPHTTHLMPTFPRNPYPSTTRLQTLGERYRRLLHRNPFILFGLPFVAIMVAGSFFLTPATAVRYEKYDRKTHMLDRDEALGLGRVRQAAQNRGEKRGGGKGDIREEYWRLAGRPEKLDNWEVKRVERLPGEPDGRFE